MLDGENRLGDSEEQFLKRVKRLAVSLPGYCAKEVVPRDVLVKEVFTEEVFSEEVFTEESTEHDSLK